MLPSFYNYPGKEQVGIFFKDQAQAVQSSGVRTDILYVEPRSLHELAISSLKENHFQITATEEDSLLTIRQKGWNPLLSTVMGGFTWAALTQSLIERYLKRYGAPDIIHAHNVFWAGYAASNIAKKHNIPLIVTEHSSAFLLDDLSTHALPSAIKAFSCADRIAAVSKSLAASLDNYVSGKKIEVIPNVVDTDFFSLPLAEPDKEPFVFLALANLNLNKGFHFLIRAFDEAFHDRKDVHLQIGGDGPERQALVFLAMKLGISKQVHFLGYLSRTEVRTAMWRSHAFVLSSFKETFGVVLIEALATGLPVIATRSGGPEDIVTQETGLLVQPGDVIDMSAALLKMSQHRIYARRNLRNYAVSNYSRNCIAAKIGRLYHDVLSPKAKS